jgi:hypothetical protein
MKETLKTAGVTFANPDGESRQEILKSFGDGTFITVNLIKQTYFNPQTKIPELAIACFEKNTKKQIGYIPKADIEPEIIKMRQLTGYVSVFNDTYYCVLTKQQEPDTKMYSDMKQFCENIHLKPPAYDTRAYIQFIDNNPVAAQISAKQNSAN